MGVKFQFLSGKLWEIAFIVLDVLSLSDKNCCLSCNRFTELTQFFPLFQTTYYLVLEAWDADNSSKNHYGLKM